MTSAQGQASLFDDPASFPEAEARPSHDRDDPSMRARRLVAQFGRQLEPVQRVRLALELSGLAETIIAEAVADARRAGRSWRQLGVDLGVPFQTLFRRYGSNRSGG